MSDKKNIFPEEIELSEIVLDKTNQAFEFIEQEGTDYMEKTNRKGRRFFSQQAAAIAGVCILAASSISTAAAIHHHWGRGMNGKIQASDTQQQELTESGVAKVYRDNPDYSSLAVTDNGITVVPDTVVADDRFAYLSFRISGFSLPDGEDPGFDGVVVYQGDNPGSAGSTLDIYGGSMYDGIVPDENGMLMYDDGSPLEDYEDGSTIPHYTDSNGDMEYVIRAGIVDENDSLIGKTIHVDFKDLGTLAKADFALVEKGNWNFEITLPDVSMTRDIKVGKQVEGTGFVMDSISISPVSIKVDYSVSEVPETKEDDLGIPEVKGIVLKDGTKIPHICDGGAAGYTDDTMANAYERASFNRVVDVDEIAALIVMTSYEKEKIEIPISQ